MTRNAQPSTTLLVPKDGYLTIRNEQTGEEFTSRYTGGRFEEPPGFDAWGNPAGTPTPTRPSRSVRRSR